MCNQSTVLILAALVVAAIGGATGCGDEAPFQPPSVDMGDGESPCVCEPGRSVECACASGEQGAQLCGSSCRDWLECACEVEGGAPTGATTGAHGQPCNSDGSCGAGLTCRGATCEALGPCSPNEFAPCACPQGDTSYQSCNEYGTGWLPCECPPHSIDPNEPCEVGSERQCGSYAPLGICRWGRSTCLPGSLWSECNGGVAPASQEVCNGLDDTCDGTTDEGFALGVPCTAGLGACERQGHTVCDASGTGVTCNAIPGTPRVTEICGNGIDDICTGGPSDAGCCVDGTTRPCGSTDEGACSLGIESCVGGSFGACEGAVEPTPEVSDGYDNDCDASIDENLCDHDLLGDNFGCILFEHKTFNPNGGRFAVVAIGSYPEGVALSFHEGGPFGVSMGDRGSALWCRLPASYEITFYNDSAGSGRSLTVSAGCTAFPDLHEFAMGDIISVAIIRVTE